MIKPSEVGSVLESAWCMRSEIVPCFIGAPGIGKTQGVYEFAKKKGAKVVEIIASQILPNEVSGITMPVADSHSMEIYDHARLSSLKDGDILFFDELLQAPPQTLSACLTLIQERRLMSGKKLPDIMIVAAANPLNSPTMIPLSIRQRFMFVEVKFDRDEYQDYMIRKYQVRITPTLLGRIKSDSDQYNALTPRTLTKLVQWGLETGPLDIGYRKMVGSMFDDVVLDEIAECLEPDDRMQVIRAVKECVAEHGWDEEIVEVVSGSTLHDMLDVISSLPEGDAILEYLGAKELKEGEVDV